MDFRSGRRAVLVGLATLPLLATAAPGQIIPPTPSCRGRGEPTIEETEGPYFKLRSPERKSLIEPGVDGDRLILSGFVLTRTCQPVVGAMVDIWQADNYGQYDNSGFRLRGHQFTDSEGRYEFETIVPEAYAGRTRHIHARIRAAEGGPVLTTQIYFPDESGNRRDSLFKPALLMTLQQGIPKRGRFDFILTRS